MIVSKLCEAMNGMAVYIYFVFFFFSFSFYIFLFSRLASILDPLSFVQALSPDFQRLEKKGR